MWIFESKSIVPVSPSHVFLDEFDSSQEFSRWWKHAAAETNQLIHCQQLFSFQLIFHFKATMGPWTQSHGATTTLGWSPHRATRPPRCGWEAAATTRWRSVTLSTVSRTMAAETYRLLPHHRRRYKARCNPILLPGKFIGKCNTIEMHPLVYMNMIFVNSIVGCPIAFLKDKNKISLVDSYLPINLLKNHWKRVKGKVG